QSLDVAERCAAWFRGDAMSSPLDDDPMALARATIPLSDAEVVDLTATLSRNFSSPNNVARRTAERILGDPGATPAQRIVMGQRVAARLKISSVSESSLAEELPRVSHGKLPEEQLVRLRSDILAFLAETARLGPSGGRIALAQLEDALATLAARAGPGTIPA